MKKWLIIIGVVLLAAVIGVSTFFIVRAVKKDDKQGPSYEILYLEDSYVKGEQIAMRVKMTSDKQLERIVYAIDNGEEVNTSAITGKTEEAKDEMPGNGKNFIDTKTVLIDSNNLAEGDHTMRVYVYDVEGNKIIVTKTVINFAITPSTAA